MYTTVLGRKDASVDKKDKNICSSRSYMVLPETQHKQISRVMTSTMGKNKIVLREWREWDQKDRIHIR